MEASLVESERTGAETGGPDEWANEETGATWRGATSEEVIWQISVSCADANLSTPQSGHSNARAPYTQRRIS